MARLSPMLRSLQGGRVAFWCPGCERVHSVGVAAPAPVIWEWDGNADHPTFSPSLKVTYPANPDADDAHAEWRAERICHSFIRDGKIQFLPDSTHALSGETVTIPCWPYENFGVEA